MAGELAPYERLVKLIELELELAAQGRLDELERAVQARGRHLRALALPAPAAAEQLLLRAQALHSRLLIETRRLADALERRREARVLARRLARAYTGPSGPTRYRTQA